MDSPKKLGRRLGRASCALSHTTTNSKADESPNRLKQRKENYIASSNSEPSRNKTLPNILRQISSLKDSAEAGISSQSLNDSSGGVDLFDDSMDSSSHLEQSAEASLPFQTANLPGLAPLREKQLQHNIDSSVLQSLNPSNVTDDENLPATQPSSAYILSSVVAYVEVRSGGDNRSRLIMRELRSLGATVAETITKKVTHVVFKDGKLSTYKLAVSKQIRMVSTMWIDQCRKAKKIVPEHLYPPYDLEYYKNPEKHKMIKRVKSFQPDYDMDQEQRLKRIRKRMRPKPVPVVTTPTHVPVADEYESEFEFMRRLVNTKMKRYQSPGECSLARGLRTIAGPIDPKYNDYIHRTVSPTSSEDEMIPVPLAVKLMREIQSPGPNSSKSKMKLLQREQPDDENIEAAMAALFRESSDTDSSDIIPQKSSQQAVSSQTPECFTTRTKDLDENADEPPAKLRKTEALKCSALETTEIIADNAPLTPGPAPSQRAVRKLFNAPSLDDSPKLILPSSSDTESSQSMSKIKTPARNKKRKRAVEASLPAEDMDMTECVGNAILDDPSSVKIKNKRKSVRINSRRSSAFFIPPKARLKTDVKLETSVSVKSLPTIVCTSLKHEEVDVIKLIAKQLGGFEVEDTVSRKTTHVVSMNKCTRRTVNILRGIARGCWIVCKMWALKSLEAGRWIPEDEFEWTDFSPAVQLCRYERMAFSPYYRADFFRDCGPIFVSGATKPPRKELYELLCLCGGRVTFSASLAKIVVGETGDDESVAYVSVTWVLDSIQAAAVKPTAEYAL